ncbi:MAG: LuxR C-terminal-related transcriptional regulator [Steroidobacteraceae bacterium]
MAQPNEKQYKQNMSAALSLLARVADCVGDAAFYGELLRAFGKHLGADLSMVMRYSRRNAPEYLIHDGLESGHMELYLRGLYRVDPIYRLCRRRRVQGVKDLAAVSTPADRSGDYFNVFLRLTGMADDLVMLLPVDVETCVGVVYERKTLFRSYEIAEMRALFPLVESLHQLHQRLSRTQSPPNAGGRGRHEMGVSEPGLLPIDHKTALGSFLRHELTPRERDIVHLILMGYPNIKIAERLKLSVNTVKNHKKRMYLKLDINTERELFLAFVNFLITGHVGKGPYGVHWQ